MPDRSFESQTWAADLQQRAGSEMGRAINDATSSIQGGIDRMHQNQRDARDFRYRNERDAREARMEQRKMALAEREFSMRQQEGQALIAERQQNTAEAARRLEMLNAVNVTQQQVIATKTHEQQLRALELENNRREKAMNSDGQFTSRESLERVRASMTSDEALLRFRVDVRDGKIVPASEDQIAQAQEREDKRMAQQRLSATFDRNPKEAILAGWKKDENGYWARMGKEEHDAAIRSATDVGLFRTTPTARARDITAVGGLIETQIRSLQSERMSIMDADPNADQRRKEIDSQIAEMRKKNAALLQSAMPDSAPGPDPNSLESRMDALRRAFEEDDDQEDGR